MMPVSSKASNALYAKCRAMQGKLLTSHDVQNLIACRSLSEIAVYLKQNTTYAPALAHLDEKLTHRGQLEAELNRLLFERYESLCRYELSVGEHLAEYIILSTEAKQLLGFLQCLNAGNPQDYLFSLPSFFEAHTVVDLMGLSQVTNYEEFLEHIQKSRFYPTLRKIAPKDGEALDYPIVENAVYSCLSDFMIDGVNKYYTTSERTELQDIFGTETDLHNVSVIYRLKKYYRYSPDLIRSMVYTHKGCGRISPRVFSEMIDAPTQDDVIKLLLTKTPYRSELDEDTIKRMHIDNALRSVRYKHALHYMRFSTNPSVVLVSFMNICQTELTELITIIEGVRYGLSADEIADLISIDDFVR